MTNAIDDLLSDDPAMWISELPTYQSEAIAELLKTGKTYNDIALIWLTATAQNTFVFGASKPIGDRSTFLASVKTEIRGYLCGDSKYKKERDGLFSEKGVTRTYVVSAIAVIIAPHIGMAAPVLAPMVALVLASVGKITINAWCNMSEGAGDA